MDQRYEHDLQELKTALSTVQGPNTRLLRGEQVADILNCSRAHAFRLMQHGHIPTVKIGRSVRVRPEDLDEFIRSNIRQ